MEDPRNIAMICKTCTDERKKNVQEIIKDVKSESLVGKYAKIPFTEGEQVEHMWVKIGGIIEGGFFGFLENDPVVISIKFGDRIEFQRSEIEEVYLK